MKRSTVEGDRLRWHLARLEPGEAVTTIVNYEEQTRGWLAYVARARSVSEQINAYAKLHRHLNYYLKIPVIAFDERAAVEFQWLGSPASASAQWT